MRIPPRLISLGLFLFLIAPARADECRYGDVVALFNNWPVFVGVQARGGLTTRMVEQIFGATGGPCQYRLFASHEGGNEPPIQSFTSRQHFWGGISMSIPYKLLGLTLEQAQRDLELVEDRVWIIPADSRWKYKLKDLDDHERILLHSTFRQSVDTFGDHWVSQQRGIIETLPPGRYVSLWTQEYPGNPELQALHPDDPDWVGFFSAFEESAIVHLDIVP